MYPSNNLILRSKARSESPSIRKNAQTLSRPNEMQTLCEMFLAAKQSERSRQQLWETQQHLEKKQQEVDGLLTIIDELREKLSVAETIQARAEFNADTEAQRAEILAQRVAELEARNAEQEQESLFEVDCVEMDEQEVDPVNRVEDSEIEKKRKYKREYMRWYRRWKSAQRKAQKLAQQPSLAAETQNQNSLFASPGFSENSAAFAQCSHNQAMELEWKHARDRKKLIDPKKGAPKPQHPQFPETSQSHYAEQNLISSNPGRLAENTDLTLLSDSQLREQLELERTRKRRREYMREYRKWKGLKRRRGAEAGHQLQHIIEFAQHQGTE